MTQEEDKDEIRNIIEDQKKLIARMQARILELEAELEAATKTIQAININGEDR